MYDSFVYCIYLHVYRAGPDARRGLMNVLGRANGMLRSDLYRAGPDGYRARPIVCMVCGKLGNSLSFVLMVFSLCFRYFRFEGEELGMIASHTPCFPHLYL